MDNQHQKIAGYRDLMQTEIDAMSAVEGIEREFTALWKRLGGIDAVDQYWLGVARTHIEEAIACARCAVMQASRVAVARPALPLES